MHLLFIQFIYSSLLSKTDLFYFKRPGKDEIKPGDNEKSTSCLFSVQNKRLSLFFFFFQNKANNSLVIYNRTELF